MADMMKKVTRKDVAKLAGVSESMVSYVLNDYKYVAEDKKKRVLEAVEALNYRPNAIARSLKTNKSNHIIFIVDNLSNENFGRMVEHMEKLVYDEEYLITLCSARNDSQYTNLIASKQFDGIIISSFLLTDETITNLAKTGVPVIIFENRICKVDLSNVIHVDTGLYSGSVMAMEYLLHEKKREHIVFIDRIVSDREQFEHFDLKKKAYLDTLDNKGMTYGEDYCITGCHSEEEILERLQRLLDEGKPIDGIYGRNDRLAILAIHYLQEKGYRIPEDISIIGFDNSSGGKYVRPQLTSVMVDREAVADTAFKLIHDPEYRKKAVTQHLPILVTRHST